MLETIELSVSGMSCDGCENAVRGAVGDLSGVDAVEADHATGRVVVKTTAPVTMEAITAAIIEAGFTVA